MDDLNPQQREAVEAVEGPMLILAGAGSGKTRVITQRIVYLMERAEVRPENILAVTFTNKAGEEMKARVEAMLGPGLRKASPLISTFHSFCVRVLRRNIARLEAGYSSNFTIYDTDDQLRVVRQIQKETGLDEKSYPARQVLSTISWAKNRQTSPAAYLDADHVTERREKTARVYQLYEQRLAQSNALDFDDLLIKAVELLRRIDDVRQYYHERFRHVMIDEFQDTNGIQYQLARLITAGEARPDRAIMLDEGRWKKRSLCVVGDLDQSIYAFRGSDFNIILNFQHDFLGTRTIRLEQNYRSTQTILDAANRVIEHNRRRLAKTLLASEALGRGEKIRYYQSYDGEGEAAFVGDRIQEHLRQPHDARLVVLYRTNAQSRLFEESLRRRGVPYNIVGGFSFYERAEVKDVIAYLKLALNPNDDIAMARVINTPARGIGKTTLDTLTSLQRELGLSLWEATRIAIERFTLAPRATKALRGFRDVILRLLDRVAAGQSLSEIVKGATMDTGYVRALEEEKTVEAEGRLQNIEELANAAVEAETKGDSLMDFIDHAALVSDTDQYRADARATLMTMHSAKGLEFPIVFIAGMEEGLFPHSRSAASEDDLEEERRLCYVAITRAQKLVYVTHAKKRRTFGEEAPAEPSRFLNEIPLELMENLSPGASWLGFATPSETRAPSGEPTRAIKRTSTYQGKTYNSVESVAEFFKRRTGASDGRRTRAARGRRISASADEDEVTSESHDAPAAQFGVGSRVRHKRYGVGVVLRSEGAGEDAKLTVSFPGFGQKKFVARFAALERA